MAISLSAAFVRHILSRMFTFRKDAHDPLFWGVIAEPSSFEVDDIMKVGL